MTAPIPFQKLVKAVQPAETTALPPEQEAAFLQWVKANKIEDLDHPDSHYDYRGAFLAGVNPAANGHYPDTFKQHGHPTFSVESKYSTGPHDGGQWKGEDFQTPTPLDSVAQMLGMKNNLGRRKP